MKINASAGSEPLRNFRQAPEWILQQESFFQWAQFICHQCDHFGRIAIHPWLSLIWSIIVFTIKLKVNHYLCNLSTDPVRCDSQSTVQVSPPRWGHPGSSFEKTDICRGEGGEGRSFEEESRLHQVQWVRTITLCNSYPNTQAPSWVEKCFDKCISREGTLRFWIRVTWLALISLKLILKEDLVIQIINVFISSHHCL